MKKNDIGQEEFLKTFKNSLKSDIESFNLLIQDYYINNSDDIALEDLSTFYVKKEEEKIKPKDTVEAESKEKDVVEKLKDKEQKSIKKTLDNASTQELIYILDQETKE
jgi:hypothetical protein